MRNLGVKDDQFQRYLSGINVFYYGFAKAVEIASSAGDTYPNKVVIPGKILVNEDVIVPENVFLYYTSDGCLDIAKDRTVRVKGAVFSEGLSDNVGEGAYVVENQENIFSIETVVSKYDDIEMEGEVGFNKGVILSDGEPEDTTNKLYNIAGVIYWNGSPVMDITGSSRWEADGVDTIKPKLGRKVDYLHIANKPEASDYDISDLADSSSWKDTLATKEALEVSEEELTEAINNNSVYTINNKTIGDIIYVSTTGSDSNTGMSIQESKLTIQNAIDTAIEGNLILLDAGTYEINQEISLNKGISIIGIYGAEKTIIQPITGLQIRCMYVSETKNAQIIGITFKNGYTTLAGSGVSPGNGGGICIWQDTGSSPDKIGSMIKDCVIENCYAQQYGGGAYLMDHKSAIINSTVKNCSTGGGMAGGGGIGLRWEGYAYNCLVYGCSSAYGGGIISHSGTCKIENCTVVDNIGGYGIVLFNGTDHILYNSIVINNSGGNIAIPGGTADIRYTCSFPIPSGQYNLNEDPLFIDSANKDYQLSSLSTLKDRGLRRSWHDDFPDLNGIKIRYNISLGCYFYDESIFQELNIKAATDIDYNLTKILESVNNETKTLDSIEAVTDGAYRYDYVIFHDSDVRAGSIILVWEDTTNQSHFTEMSTNSIGDTDDFIFNVSSVGGFINFEGTSVNEYIVKLNRYSF